VQLNKFSFDAQVGVTDADSQFAKLAEVKNTSRIPFNGLQIAGDASARR
jgi:hypothetical protein